MARRIVEVTTGSRLHFGMTSFGRRDARQFGGAGAMIDTPALRLRIAAADALTVCGPAAEIAERHLDTIAAAFGGAASLRCRIEIIEAPVAHAGLGSGTQMALALVSGLNAFCGRPKLAPAELARCAGRARRSAVGLYGFCHGGLILEGGKFSAEEISPLVARAALPEAWRFVLLRRRDAEGLSGEAERTAFAQLPPATAEASAAMEAEAAERLLPAAAAARFDDFSASLWRFGQAAGKLFAPLQGGVYVSAEVARLVEALRELGVQGVGQSSWGPTVFAALPSEAAACELITTLASIPAAEGCACEMARPLNRGATVEALEI